MTSIAQAILAHAPREHVRIPCPDCAGQRKRPHQSIPTLSVTYTDDKYLYLCHHCGVKGSVQSREHHLQPAVQQIKPERPRVGPLTQTTIDWLASRGISKETAERCGVGQSVRWFNRLGREGLAVAFHYPDATKFRSIEAKDFNCVGSPATLWLADKIGGDSPPVLALVEGELDALAAAECGIQALSVPHGAGATGQHQIDPANDRQFGYIWAAEKLLKRTGKIVIATDKDAPGEALGNELARRIGRERVCKAFFPAGTKDINELLLSHGKEDVRSLIESAEPWPISGLHEPAEYREEVAQLYAHGLPRGESTGWANVDDILSIKQGLLHVVTGVPASGKTTWLNNLLVNLAKAKSIKTCFASFELQPSSIHIAQLASQYVGLPFGNQSSVRMTEAQMQDAMAWVNEHFMFLSQQETPTVPSLLERFRAAVMRKGVRAVVIDPMNFVRFPGAENGSEQDALNQALAAFKTFALANDVAFFLVAHPKKPDTLGGEFVPGGYAISGTAGYYNRADIGITIQRVGRGSRIHCWKSRFAHLAQHGSRDLDFDLTTGRFTEPNGRIDDDAFSDF